MTQYSDQELVLEWLKWKEHNQGRAAGSVNKYLSYLTGLTEWLAGRGKRLIHASKEDLEEYAGIEAHKKGMSPRSRRPLVAAIRGFYQWAKQQWYVQDSPAEHLPYPTAGERLPRGMTLRHAEKLLMQPDLNEFIGVRDAAILALFIGCGLRLGGLVRLNQSDLIFMEQDGQEWMVIRIREKGDKERMVPAPHEARLLLRAYLGHHELDLIDRTLNDGDQVLFVSTMNRTVPPHEYNGENRRLDDNVIYKMVAKYGEQAGIPKEQCHPHALRHLYGTELTESDVQQRKIQVLMGHADVKSTARYQRVAMRTLIKDVQRANPLAKIHTPVTELARHLTK